MTNHQRGQSLREYLDHKPNFIKGGTWGFSLICAPILLWGLGKNGGLIYWLFIVGMTFIGGWAWAHAAWRMVEKDRQSQGK